MTPVVLAERGCYKLVQSEFGYAVVCGETRTAIGMSTEDGKLVVLAKESSPAIVLLMESYMRRRNFASLTFVPPNVCCRGYTNGTITREGSLAHVTFFAEEPSGLVSLGFPEKNKRSFAEADIIVGNSKSLDLTKESGCIAVFLTDRTNPLESYLPMSPSVRMANVRYVPDLEQIPDLCNWNF
jgi:hypothetical protein